MFLLDSQRLSHYTVEPRFNDLLPNSQSITRLASNNCHAENREGQIHNDIIIQSSAVSSQPLTDYLHKPWPTTAHALLDQVCSTQKSQCSRIASSSSSTVVEKNSAVNHDSTTQASNTKEQTGSEE
jgi:hypothetical protein